MRIALKIIPIAFAVATLATTSCKTKQAATNTTPKTETTDPQSRPAPTVVATYDLRQAAFGSKLRKDANVILLDRGSARLAPFLSEAGAGKIFHYGTGSVPTPDMISIIPMGRMKSLAEMRPPSAEIEISHIYIDVALTDMPERTEVIRRLAGMLKSGGILFLVVEKNLDRARIGGQGLPPINPQEVVMAGQQAGMTLAEMRPNDPTVDQYLFIKK